jgi:hypothetical protein
VVGGGGVICYILKLGSSRSSTCSLVWFGCCFTHTLYWHQRTIGNGDQNIGHCLNWVSNQGPFDHCPDALTNRRVGKNRNGKGWKVSENKILILGCVALARTRKLRVEYDSTVFILKTSQKRQQYLSLKLAFILFFSCHSQIAPLQGIPETHSLNAWPRM